MSPSLRTPKRIAILQSNYVPWKGYFHMVNSVDEFVLLDSVQYTRSDWRNRNRIKTPYGIKWLSVPVLTSGRLNQSIYDARVSDETWPVRHWNQLCEAYRKAPAFPWASEQIQALYSTAPTRWMWEINDHFLRGVNRLLNIPTLISRDQNFDLGEDIDKTERVLQICLQANASEYVSGAAAKVYLDVARFQQQGIKVTWFDYPDFPVYPQLHPPFSHAVSVLDVFFHLGPTSPSHVLCKDAPPSSDRP